MSGCVPIDLHRRRSVVMHKSETGAVLGWIRLANDPGTLVAEVLKAGEAPQVAIEATYGWYRPVDALQQAGANVHLVAPARVSAFDGRRVNNDPYDWQLLGDLMRAGMVPEAWVGVHTIVSDLFGKSGRELLAHLCADDPRFHSSYGQRVESLLVVITAVGHGIDELNDSIGHQLCDHAGYKAIQVSDGIGPVTAADVA